MRQLAPYQIFFPIGIFGAVVAVTAWLFRDAGWFAAPVLLIHSRLIFGGFLWSFITGFLLTSAPRITGREPASRGEVGIALALIATLFGGAWTNGDRAFYGAGFAQSAEILRVSALMGILVFADAALNLVLVRRGAGRWVIAKWACAAMVAFVVVRGLAPQLGALAGALGYGAGYAAALMLGIWLLKRD